MGTQLSSDAGIALLINTASTVLVLTLLILLLGPVSGAHFNPAVTLVARLGRKQQSSETFAYILAQVIGAIVGAVVANLMFVLPAIQISNNARDSLGTLLGEVIATAGLITVIGVLSARNQTEKVPVAVASWIGSAYFFTSSTSFANPAVTIGRIFSDTFAGIAPVSVLPFITAQLVGAAIGIFIVKGITKEQEHNVS